MTDAPPPAPTAATGPTPRKRSPNFPGIPLPKAIERAQTIYDAVKQHPIASTKIAVDYWGYSAPTTGPAQVTYAALKRYGLLAEEGQGGSRVAHLTDLALEILHPNPNRDAAIQKAALSPSIFREWWNQYGADLPPSDALEWEYVVKGPFTDEGFQSFLAAYRDTISFAKLSKSATIHPDEAADPGPDVEESDDDDAKVDGSIPPDPKRKQPRHQDRKPGVVSISLPLPAFGPDEPVVIEFPGKLREKDWTYFLALITAMKDGVVQEDEPSDE